MQGCHVFPLVPRALRRAPTAASAQVLVLKPTGEEVVSVGRESEATIAFKWPWQAVEDPWKNLIVLEHMHSRLQVLKVRGPDCEPRRWWLRRGGLQSDWQALTHLGAPRDCAAPRPFAYLS